MTATRTILAPIPAPDADPAVLAVAEYERNVGLGSSNVEAMRAAFSAAGVSQALEAVEQLQGQVAERDLQIQNAGRALAQAA